MKAKRDRREYQAQGTYRLRPLGQNYMAFVAANDDIVARISLEDLARALLITDKRACSCAKCRKKEEAE